MSDKKESIQKRGVRKLDVMVIAGVIALAIVCAVISQVLSHQAASKLSDGPYVVIQNQDGVQYSKPLRENIELPISSKLGNNTIKIENSICWMKSSDCENQICVNTGKISKIGDMIVCLPHELMVQIVADPKDAAALNISR